MGIVVEGGCLLFWPLYLSFSPSVKKYFNEKDNEPIHEPDLK
jgi:hypothetical protein